MHLSEGSDDWEQQAERVAADVSRGTAAGITGHPTLPLVDAPGMDRRTRAGLMSTRSPRALRALLMRPGRPLDESARRSLEPHLGRDLGGVRIHTDGVSAAAASAVDASAFTVGRHIAFAPGRYAPGTAAGRHLLAHELTHVIQLGDTPSAQPATVLRRGLTWRGFFANLFQSWDYSKETLDRYIAYLDSANQILDDDDSDDMARQVVAEWKVDKSRYTLEPAVRNLLVREMLSGYVGDSDQEGILDLLEGSTASELETMFRGTTTPLNFAEIVARFDTYKSRLTLFNERVLNRLGTYRTPDATKGQSVAQLLEDTRRKHGIVFNDVSVSFSLAAGVLYESFKADLVVQSSDTQVTITLTPGELSVRISPPVFVDIAWPVANAHLGGFVLRFDGLKTEVDIVGWDLVSETAQEQLRLFVAGLLAGTRFADPKYNPVEDPHLVGEIADRSLIGDIDRVKYNFERNLPTGDEKKDDGKDSKLADTVSSPSIELKLTHETGKRLGGDKWAMVIEPDTRFTFTLSAAGSGSQLLQKNASLRRMQIRTSKGLFIVRGGQRIVSVDSVAMEPGLKMTIGGVHWLADLKKILKEEYPGKLADNVASLAEAVDSLRDLFSVLGTGPRSNVLGDLAHDYAESALRDVLHTMLREHGPTIRSTLNITEEQLNGFFGVAPTRSDR